jgi:hypothetical protein
MRSTRRIPSPVIAEIPRRFLDDVIIIFYGPVVKKIPLATKIMGV